MNTTRGACPAQPAMKHFTRILDPFGIATSLMAVQRAWLEHPSELAQNLTNLGKQAWAVHVEALERFWGLNAPDVVKPKERDERFQSPLWTEVPALDLMKEYYLLYTRWLEDSIYATPEVPDKVKRKAAFWARQWLNAIAPTNFFWTNPHALQRLMQTGGASLTEGMRKWLEDLGRGDIRMVDNGAFRVGENLATTSGQVVFRNELLEVIQYRPSTAQVRTVPVVIISPWINKYYILDLNQQKSLIRYLVSQGLTVFVTSWKNPTKEMRNTTLDDYMLNGALRAVRVAQAISGSPVHAVGYCIGGTILAALMAWINRESDTRDASPIASWTLFTALTDFSDPGEIDVFIDEDSISAIEQGMATRGYLDGSELTRSFRMLRSNSLIWHYFVGNYLYGEEPPPFDVLYWNIDNTRLPEAMHSFYLRELYLNNKLAQKDGVTLGGRPIDLRLITQPVYNVGTEQDHIAPWKATFKNCALVRGPVRYALATSGHILGIISPPVDPPKRRYWAGDASGQTDAEAWRAAVEKRPGSWWEDWRDWLHVQCGAMRELPAMGSPEHPPLAEAPGTYVLEK